ncbi:MAG: ZIP family metal transporter, partial [Clostridiales bacterium]|nr:ZIP family metal transporter [Clostridiales bacterium]
MNKLSTFAWISIFAIGAMLVNSFGIWAIYKNREWAEKTKEYCMCFAAGVLISSPLIIAFPQALQKNAYAGFASLVGFIFMYFSNKIIKYKTKQRELAFGITAIEGILIHSLMDGVIYTVTFSINTVIGVLTGIGLVIHEFAEGVITFSMLLKGGLSVKKAGIYAFIVAALTTPIGAFIAYPIIRNLTNDILGLALGFVAGVLIYVSASHLLPEASEHEKKHSTL